MSKEARSAELRDKFETAVPSIQEKLKVEAERRQQQRLDNEDLRGKLVNFAEQAKLRCSHRALPVGLEGWGAGTGRRGIWCSFSYFGHSANDGPPIELSSSFCKRHDVAVLPSFVCSERRRQRSGSLYLL